MIINIRGTSGSGKSTLVRKIMAMYERRFPVRIPDRKQPIGYILTRQEGRTLGVLGHYETSCGGCDTIMSQDEIYERVRATHHAGMDVLFEGLLVSAEVNRLVALHAEGLPVRVVALSTPLDVCLASVNKRRQDAYEQRLERIQAENSVKAEHGHKLLEIPEPKGEVNPRNTESKHKGVIGCMRRFEAAGVSCTWATRDEALDMIKRELLS